MPLPAPGSGAPPGGIARSTQYGQGQEPGYGSKIAPGSRSERHRFSSPPAADNLDTTEPRPHGRGTPPQGPVRRETPESGVAEDHTGRCFVLNAPGLRQTLHG